VPARFLSDAERARLGRFASELSEEDLAAHFTLTERDRALVRAGRRGEANRLGFALQLCALPFLGFVPDDLTSAPPEAVTYLASQLGVGPTALGRYATRDQTRTDHLLEIQAALGFRPAGPGELKELGDWLTERAMEHDKPSLLFELGAQRLRAQRVVRPGITVLERLVGTARARAEEETYLRLSKIIAGRSELLDELLQPDPSMGRSPLAWLRSPATSAAPAAIRSQLDKRAFLRERSCAEWDVTALTPNRVKFLASLARRSTNQALQRAPATRRHPALAAFCVETLTELTDEIVDLFDKALAGSDSRARRELRDLKVQTARVANDKVVLFAEVVPILLDDSVPDDQVRRAVFAKVPPERLRAAVVEAAEVIRPLDDSYFDLLATRYSHIREFAPAVLAALEFRAGVGGAEVVEAVELLRALNASHARRVPDDGPTGFVPTRWRPYVFDGEGRIVRRYWELCVLAALRDALRSGDVWVTGSRRYADPATYLLPAERWGRLREEYCAMVGTPSTASVRLAEARHELEGRLRRVEAALEEGHVRIDDGELVVSRLSGEHIPDSAVTLRELVTARMPPVELAELLIEVDGWCGFSRHLTHAGGGTPRSKDLAVHLYAAILGQACNFGLTKMAQAADLSYRQLAWVTEWYLREETLKAAMTAVVNYQHAQPLARAWGGGTLSSSDGQRFPVGPKSATATALPRYFGLGRGITFYTWTSDQFSQYGTRVIPSTVRDATYVLDGILDNETELPILEHTVDTAGYTEMVFALFGLLGLTFAPRIRDLGRQRLYRLGELPEGVGQAGHLLGGRTNEALIAEHWDDLLRVAASLKTGWVTASLLISRLQAAPRRSRLARALQEYGRLVKTLFVLRYLESEDERRRIGRQLNKGETLHGLRRELSFAGEGKVRRAHPDDQLNQASCLNLVTNCIVAWNTTYLAKVLDALRSDGHDVNEEDVGHLSPALHEHVNPYGKYHFDVERVLGRKELRPLRVPEATSA
jgi:TnpA family transposase